VGAPLRHCQRAFTEADTREIAVKVIDDRGNELLVVKSFDEVA
jgi:hypothetical protein